MMQVRQLSGVIATATLTLALLACGLGGEGANDNEFANQPATLVTTTGKSALPLSEVPPEVLAAVRAEQPDLVLSSAEAETRDSRRYLDVGGTLPDGSEIELDVMEEDGKWRVVETQRDIAFRSAPEPIRAAAGKADAAFEPTRVIESRQQGGTVIYELYGPEGGDPQGRKLEIKWDGRQASVLTREWAH